VKNAGTGTVQIAKIILIDRNSHQSVIKKDTGEPGKSPYRRSQAQDT